MGSLVIVGLLALVVTGVSLVVLPPWWSARRPPRDTPAPRATLAAAEARAEALLIGQLTPAQYTQLQREGALDLPSPGIPGRVYRIPRRRGMVAVYEGGRLRWWLCVGPAAWLPDADVVLTHTLMIAGDEPGYLRAANHFPATGWATARVATRPRRGERRA